MDEAGAGSTPLVTVEATEGVALITLQRPPMNALSVAVQSQIAAAAREVDQLRDVAAFVRVIPGFVLSAFVWWMVSWLKRDRTTVGVTFDRRWSNWVLAAALFGPVLGVSCFQWALGQETSAIVLSITAITPIIVIPMTTYMNGDRPSAMTLAGSAIAVTGVILVLVTG